MFFNPDHDRDIYRVLNLFPDGIKFYDLFDLTELFVEERELSTLLFRRIQAGDIFKKDNLYFLSDKHKNEEESITEKIRSLIKNVHVNGETSEERDKKINVRTFDVKRTFIQPIPSSKPTTQPSRKPRESKPKMTVMNSAGKPFGEFKPNTLVGNYAYLFFVYRNSCGLNYEALDILARTKSKTKTALYQILHSLKNKKYITYNSFKQEYSWSNIFAYPFKSLVEDDTAFAPLLSPEDFLMSKHPYRTDENSSPASSLTSMLLNVNRNNGSDIPLSTPNDMGNEVKTEQKVLLNENRERIKKYFTTEIERLEAEVRNLKELRSLLE